MLATSSRQSYIPDLNVNYKFDAPLWAVLQKNWRIFDGGHQYHAYAAVKQSSGPTEGGINFT